MRLITIFCFAILVGSVWADLPTEEPMLRVEIWAGAEDLEISLQGDWIIESSPTGSSPESPEVMWTEVAQLASGEGLSMIAPDSGMVAFRDAGESLAIEVPHARLRAVEEGATLTLSNVPYGLGWWWEGQQDRTYVSPIEIHRWDAVAPEGGHAGFGPEPEGGLQVVAVLGLEEYLRGVVPHEIGVDAPTEALRAQAIAARTETLFKFQRTNHPDSNVDCCSEVHCMVYGGIQGHDPRSDAAVADTSGMVSVAEGELIDAVYASNCGGWTESIENTWPDRSGRSDPTPWLTGIYDSDEPLNFDLTTEEDLILWVDDPPTLPWCCAESPNVPDWSRRNWRWERTFSDEETAEMVSRRLSVGWVMDFEPLERGVSGRLISLRVTGSDGTVEVGPELAIRQLFDPPLRSAACYFEYDDDEGWIIRGAGWGHGVGMCQTGAMGMANVGRSAEEILSHYYRGTELVTLYE